MTTAVEKLEASIGHQCQTGCGNRADVVMVQLATAETDMLCQPCLVAMMTAVIAEVAEQVPDADLSGVGESARLAAEAAAAVLASP